MSTAPINETFCSPLDRMVKLKREEIHNRFKGLTILRLHRSCVNEDWRPGKDFLAEAAHVRFLDAKLFQLQVLSICLAAAVIVLALSAVFLCTKWRLA